MDEEEIVIIGLGLMGAVLAVLGAASLILTVLFLRRAQRVVGTVVEVRERELDPPAGKTEGKTIYQPIFEFTDRRGATRRAYMMMYSARYDFDIGSRHAILIDPKHENGAELLSLRVFAPTVGFLGGGAALVALSVLAWTYY